MSEPQKLSEESVLEEMPRIISLLSGMHILKDDKVWIAVSAGIPATLEEDLRLGVVAVILSNMIPGASEYPMQQENGQTRIGVIVPRQFYETAIKPRYPDEPMQDRVKRFLEATGYGALAEKLEHIAHPEIDAWEAQVRSSGRGGRAG